MDEISVIAALPEAQRGTVVVRRPNGYFAWTQDNLLYIDRRRAENAEWKDIGQEMRDQTGAATPITTLLSVHQKWLKHDCTMSWAGYEAAGTATKEAFAGWPRPTMTDSAFVAACRATINDLEITDVAVASAKPARPMTDAERHAPVPIGRPKGRALNLKDDDTFLPLSGEVAFGARDKKKAAALFAQVYRSEKTRSASSSNI